MNLKNLICVFLLYLSILPASKACSCIFAPDYFCQAANEDLIIARVKEIIWNFEYYTVEVIDVLSNHNVADTITINGQDGGNCAAFIPFAQGGDFLIALRFWEYNGVIEYELSDCGRHFIPIPENDTLSSNFDPCIESIAYADFASDIQFCLDQGLVNVSGNISHWKPGVNSVGSLSFEMNEVTIQTDENSDFFCVPLQSDEINLYQIGDTYNLIPSSNDNLSYQITIKDLLLLQRHILAIELLDHPEQYLAADVNNDGSLSLLDLVLIRKVILGQLEEFPNQNSWIFSFNNFEFDHPTEPWLDDYSYRFLSPYETYNYQSSPFLEFTAIKVGDISGDL